jgi:hypothetical protein
MPLIIETALLAKPANVLAALNVAGDKTQEAKRQLRAKGILITDRA